MSSMGMSSYAEAREARQKGQYRRLSVNVADDVGTAIDQMSMRHGWSITEVIRRAVSILKFVDDEVAHGGRVLVERDGKIREVRFL